MKGWGCEAEVLGLDKKTFFDLLTNDEAIAYKINHVLARRYQELLLKESVLDGTGLSGDRLHISIRGGASLKNTAFTRERFESVVDTVLPDLVPRIEEVLLNRFPTSISGISRSSWPGTRCVSSSTATARTS